MNKVKTLLVLAVCLMLSTSAFAENADNTPKSDSKKTEKVYLFGIGAAFGDSIVHFTSIIELDGIELEKKTGFLPYRSVFSMQLKAYLEGQLGYMQQTCSIFFSDSKKKISKKYYKLKKVYLDESGSSLRIIGQDQFKFTVPNIYTNTDEEK